MDHMYEVVNDMDLALEGVPVNNNNHHVQTGLAILEHQFPSFHYSNENLTLNDKINEIKKYCYQIGYSSNSEILELVSSKKIGFNK